MIYDVRPGFATGWITYFFPYRVNENANINDKEPFIKNEFSKTWDKFQQLYPEQFPSGVSKASVTLEWRQSQIPIQFASGYFGITLLDDEFLKPQLGWAIMELNQSKVKQTKKTQKQQNIIPKEKQSIIEKVNKTPKKNQFKFKFKNNLLSLFKTYLKLKIITYQIKSNQIECSSQRYKKGRLKSR